MSTDFGAAVRDECDRLRAEREVKEERRREAAKNMLDVINRASLQLWETFGALLGFAWVETTLCLVNICGDPPRSTLPLCRLIPRYINGEWRWYRYSEDGRPASASYGPDRAAFAALLKVILTEQAENIAAFARENRAECDQILRAVREAGTGDPI